MLRRWFGTGVRCLLKTEIVILTRNPVIFFMQNFECDLQDQMK